MEVCWLLHALVSALLVGCFRYYRLSTSVAVLAALSIGLFKEFVIDLYPSSGDIVANLVGAFIGLLL